MPVNDHPESTSTPGDVLPGIDLRLRALAVENTFASIII